MSGKIPYQKRRQLDSLLAALGLGKQEALRIKQQVEAQLAPKLPAQAPEFYRKRKSLDESPVEFLRRVWGTYMRAGVLYRFQLAALDPDLIPAIQSYCQRHNLDAKSILPPPKSAYTDALAGKMGADDAALRAASRLYRRRQEAAKRNKLG